MVEQIVFIEEVNKILSDDLFKDLYDDRSQGHWAIVFSGISAFSLTFVYWDDVCRFTADGNDTFAERFSPDKEYRD